MAMLEKNRAVMVLEEQLMGSRPTVWSRREGCVRDSTQLYSWHIAREGPGELANEV